METVKNNAGWITFVVAAALLIGLFVYNANIKSTTAQSSTTAETSTETEVDQEAVDSPVEAQTTQAADDDEQQDTTPAYRYTAQTGDSYSVLARKAIQTYGIVNNVTLSLAQIVAAETKLTVAAGSPELSEGQSVTFEPARVKAEIDAAQKISADEARAWEAYVPTVNFNTNANGQAS